ncbi:MAG: DNA recombination protein RmuC [Candidatus Sungbacteria bacterium]|uniref:DNA recombination protein RmuC n=1 Tax=Candidatus Sungiibacteriota bacterium TaxID=2750080 RepID=A0A9D6LTC8_9BACT|nr:DNA recombination protein RmuC [Candidatus Sungbacteria bacterium]
MIEGIILALIIAGFGITAFLLWRARRAPESQSLLLLQNQIAEITRTLDSRLGESSRAMQSQFGESAKIIRDVTERLTKLDETNRQVVGFADQLQKLQDILKNPKQRGVFGEYYLEALLKNAFQPHQYQMQYQLGRDDKTGKELIADAILRFGDKLIPIDSKFSLENYNRILEEHDSNMREQLEKAFKQDLRNRIDETSKYIHPELGTTEFAFMFIPAEGIYYDLLINTVGAIKVNTRDLIDYAINEKRVHIVSPTTFYVTLQSMSVGMRAFQIQESTKEILKNIGQLSKHLKSYSDYHLKLGAHLGTVVNTYNNSSREFKKIDKDVLRISGKSAGFEAELIEAPRALEEVE